MTGPEFSFLVVGLVVGAVTGMTLGLVVMGALAAGKDEDDRRLADAARESDELGRRNAHWLAAPPIPAQVCMACRLGECTQHRGGAR